VASGLPGKCTSTNYERLEDQELGRWGVADIDVAAVIKQTLRISHLYPVQFSIAVLLAFMIIFLQYSFPGSKL